MRSKVIIFLSIVFYSLSLKASDTIIYEGKEYMIGTYMTIFEDTNSSYQPEDFLTEKFFVNVEGKVPNLRVSNSTFWLKFSIKNLSDKSTLLIKIASPNIDKLKLYEAINDTAVNLLADLGEYKPFSERFYNYPDYLIKLKIPIEEEKTFLLSVSSNEEILLPISIGDEILIIDKENYKDQLISFYIGIMAALFLYNIAIYILVRSKVYIYYSIYIISVLLAQLALLGYAFELIWPNSMWMADRGLLLTSVFVGVMALIFAKKFLQVSNHKKLDIGIIALIVLYAIYTLIILIDPSKFNYTLIQITALLVSFYLLYVSLYIYYIAGNKEAVFFLIAWTIFLIGVFIYALKDLGILPYNNFTVYTMPVGSAIEGILLSLALANRINVLQKEKEIAQQEQIETIQNQADVLELMVTERTSELTKSNEELSITLKNLKEAQTQLVGAEKMASLGQLTAGVAHEINNPINFVTSNVNPLRRDIEDLQLVLNKYESIQPDDELKSKLEEIEKIKKEIDIDYVREEINILLNGIQDGADRTAAIVKGLRNFSRMDEDILKKTNIIEGIESTLTLLNSSIKNNIIVEKQYDEVVEIECYPGKLNQLFMNVLNNAIHAIDDMGYKNKEGKILIKVSVENGNVIISIKDNGGGIPENIKQKIFDPFFTTKPVGKGTGLGLSIVYSIVKEHNGKVKIDSEIGKGTEFIFTFPVGK